MTKTLGTLFLIGTPLGNLEDMTFRAVRILGEADELYCEDTRRTAVLLAHYKVTRKRGPKSFHDHSSRTVLMKVRELLEEGKSVAYATDGGMPVVSDPGFVLVREAIQIGARIEVIPGPSAGVTLFAASGLASPKYFFHGFFPQTHGEVDRVIEQIRTIPAAHVFYEAPFRAVKVLEILEKNIPEAEIVFGRELTKVHEEILRGKVKEVLEQLVAKQKIRGECVFAVLIAEPKRAKSSHTKGLIEGEQAEAPIELTAEQKAEIAVQIHAGISSKDAAKVLSKKFNVPRRVIYEYIVKNLT